ncbi:hypothetical protein [Niallia sp. FSL R7-0271]|uniref:hypothetical protein n=1 Tax=Niallia sp. FSL R7-0271 TaxID=2921678 RepID=UPI0030F6BDFB
MQTNPRLDTEKSAMEVFYKNINKLLDEIINDDKVNNYSSGLDGIDNKETFDSIIANLVEISEDIEQAETSTEIFSDFDLLETIFKELQDKYPDFLNEIKHYYPIVFSLCRKITEMDSTQVHELIVTDSNFVLVPIEIGVSRFVFTNQDADDTIILISLEDVIEFRESLNEVASNTLFHLLESIDFTQSPPSSNKYCFVSNRYATKINQLKSFIQLNKVAAGGEVHTPYDYRKQPSITSNISWNIMNGYHQFSDVIYILSEYNHQKIILDKYLKIYQVIENFMYKLPISAIVNGNSDMFSIRDFKNLYNKVANNEMDALEKFIKTIFREEYKTGIDFKRFIHDAWVNFASNQSKCAFIDAGLEKIGVGNKCANVNRGNMDNFLANLIYKMRNSIVHNKETEFHITYGNLFDYPGIQYLLEDFLLTVLEEVTFHLIINKNVNISYLYPNLKLFED